MNVWLTKNIRFGFRYTVNKTIRDQINSCLYVWLDDLLSKRAKVDDELVIIGGLFSNTNPSLVAIDDAHMFLKKVSQKIKVYLVNTDRDTRIFDDKSYSTLDIFSDIPNIFIIKNVKDIEYGNELINVNYAKIGNTTIPNIMQLDETEDRPGVVVFNSTTSKHVILENTFSPKHITFNVDTLDDFLLIDKVKHKNDFIHIQLCDNLLGEKKLEVNIALHNINAVSVKHIDREKEPKNEKSTVDITDSLNIIDTIFTHIGEDEKVKKQFERVLNVFVK